MVVVDDSIVRGTTSKKLMRMLRGAGVKEIHVRISSPPITWPCFYGIDTPDRDELIAAKCTRRGDKAVPRSGLPGIPLGGGPA